MDVARCHLTSPTDSIDIDIDIDIGNPLGPGIVYGL
jgi:hypothetical protein